LCDEIGGDDDYDYDYGDAVDDDGYNDADYDNVMIEIMMVMMT
jgi:hypothetical protein